jgi:DNA-directed RNA polymerase subunit beta'
MNTKHAGGAASVGGDVTQGLPRVEEVFEKRQPKVPAVVCENDGIVVGIRNEGKEKILTIAPDMTSKTAPKKKDNVEYSIPFRRIIMVSVNESVSRGQLLTDGSAHLPELFKYAGERATQEYIINETNKIYELQGVTIARKHIELIVKQMMSRGKVTSPGDTHLTTGDVIEEWNLERINAEVRANGGEPAKIDKLILGITETSLSRKSFLSAASFQNTTRILINAAVRGSQDKLTGLMENVIIGRLIPAGTGFKGSTKYALMESIAPKNEDDN